MKHNIEKTHYLIYSHYHKYSVASLTQESPITNIGEADQWRTSSHQTGKLLLPPGVAIHHIPMTF